jgi:hypothetical protein
MSTLQASGFGQIPPEGGLARNDTTRKFDLGTVISDTFGNSYRYVKAGTTVAQGMLVTAVAKAAWPTAVLVDGAVDATSATNKIHVDAFLSDYDANNFRGYYLSIAAAESGNTASNGRAYRIKSHPSVDFSASTEGDVFLEDNLSESWANNDPLLLYNPYLIEPTDAATEVVMGVAIGAITADSYGFVQIGGHCPAVLCGGTTSQAIVANEPIVPGATVATDTLAGAGIGVSGSTEVDLYEIAGSPVIALQALAADTAGYVEAFIKGLV